MPIENRNLSFPLEIKTGTPILIRIPTERFAEFSVESAQYKSIYWCSSHLKKKYKQFTDSQISTQRILEKFIFKKQVSTNIYEGNSRVPVIGSLWEFAFSDTTPKEIQSFALDSGLGERNSLGFGFMNPLSIKKNRFSTSYV
jgi:CRISPR-associated endoribonuclease Cas6